MVESSFVSSLFLNKKTKVVHTFVHKFHNLQTIEEESNYFMECLLHNQIKTDGLAAFYTDFSCPPPLH